MCRMCHSLCIRSIDIIDIRREHAKHVRRSKPRLNQASDTTHNLVPVPLGVALMVI